MEFIHGSVFVKVRESSVLHHSELAQAVEESSGSEELVPLCDDGKRGFKLTNHRLRQIKAVDRLGRASVSTVLLDSIEADL
jgi:hypothetical protein